MCASSEQFIRIKMGLNRVIKGYQYENITLELSSIYFFQTEMRVLYSVHWQNINQWVIVKYFMYVSL